MEYLDQRLLPDEDKDLRSEILRTLGPLGEEWLTSQNIHLGGSSPQDLIGTRDEFSVRVALRSLKVAAPS